MIWPNRFTALSACAVMIAATAIGCRQGNNDGMSGSASSQEELMKGIMTVPTTETPESLAAKKTQLQENLKQAQELSAQGKIREAVKLLESSVLLDHKDRELLVEVVRAKRALAKIQVTEEPTEFYPTIVSAGAYLRTLQGYFSDFTKEEKELFAGVLFDEACAHARSNRRDEFSGAFSAAISEGFADIERLKSDHDLNEFRKVPDLKSMIDQAIESISKKK